jgi:hypothetical protein
MNMVRSGPEPKFVCCFCAEPIGEEEPRLIVLPLRDGGCQNLYCHEGCFRRVLHPSFPLGWV